jgi:soluble lytic murein transglycosylase-like protein
MRGAACYLPSRRRLHRDEKYRLGDVDVPIRNKMRYICFLAAWVFMACVGAPAASITEPARPVRTVVRADKSGRLVRSVVIPPKLIPPKIVPPGPSSDTGSPVEELVEQAAKTYDLDPLLVHSVIKVESNYNPFALSNKGAEGLMQLIPSTARRFGVTNSFNAKENIDAGVRYLKYLKSVFGDDRLALAAYNAGEGTVAKYGWIPPYPETQNYVYQVGKRYVEARRAADVKKKANAQPAATPVEEHPKLERYQDDQGRVYFRTR